MNNKDLYIALAQYEYLSDGRNYFNQDYNKALKDALDVVKKAILAEIIEEEISEV